MDLTRLVPKGYGVVKSSGGRYYWATERDICHRSSNYLGPICREIAHAMGWRVNKGETYVAIYNGKIIYKTSDELIKALQEKEKENQMTKLYEVTVGEQKHYATHLAVNSAGQWVMEEKGTGSVFTADPKLCEEVKPYTIEVTNINGKKFHVTTEKGKFKVGECFLDDSIVVFVTKLDTKQDNHQGEFNPKIRFITEPV